MHNCDDLRTSNRYQLPNYVSISRVGKNGKTGGGGITTFIQKYLIYNIRHNFSVNNDDTETLYLEIINQKSKNIFINTICGEPSKFQNYFVADFSK